MRAESGRAEESGDLRAGGASSTHTVPGVVYAIGTDAPWSPVKIGYTAGGKPGVLRRLSVLQTGNPQRLRVLAWYGPCTREDEQAVHYVFGDARMEGEWFDPLVDGRVEQFASARRRDASFAIWDVIDAEYLAWTGAVVTEGAP